MEYTIDWQMESNILNTNADQKLFTANPDTNPSHICMIKAFITNRNRPKVKTVIGSVKRIKMGFTIMFKKPRTKATITDVANPSIATPDRNCGSRRTSKAVVMMRYNTSIGLLFYKIDECFVKCLWVFGM